MRLAVDELRAGYGSAVIVDGVSFEVPEHGALAVVGRNGMGKSTLLKAITGYLKPFAGSVTVGGRRTTGLATYRLARMGVAYTPQEQSLFGELSVEENLSIGRSGACPHELRDEILETFPVLRERLRQRAGTLSGGEQKMLTLAKALAMRPQLLLLDEISDGLGPAVVSAVGETLVRLRERFGCTILMVEQNLDLSLRVADRVAVLKLGSIVFERGAADDGLRDELTAQLAPG
ncbi:MAG TPA: ABC transporter ATP-binding protein [Gaiellaceae bacterium]|jgi:branched-chain amino acid transport system ATP-binding protein|nr:ABC transporter ATP-binding protein [Gaiellaceae bacterium]